MHHYNLDKQLLPQASKMVHNTTSSWDKSLIIIQAVLEPVNILNTIKLSNVSIFLKHDRFPSVSCATA